VCCVTVSCMSCVSSVIVKWCGVCVVLLCELCGMCVVLL